MYRYSSHRLIRPVLSGFWLGTIIVGFLRVLMVIASEFVGGVFIMQNTNSPHFYPSCFVQTAPVLHDHYPHGYDTEYPWR